MEYNVSQREIINNRELGELDKFVIDFCNNLEDYVIVSGYVSIVLGRSRATEDVDLLIPKMSLNKFKDLWIKLDKNGFECINTSNINEAFELLDEIAIRFCKKGRAIPNIEFKIIKKDIDIYSLQNRIKLILKKSILFISPLEMQIAYKLMLGKNGNNKDIEDAQHIYSLFKEKINKDELINLVNKLNAQKEFKQIK